MTLDKYARVTLRRGELINTENTAFYIDSEIRELDPNRPYKYLGIDETVEMQHIEMEDKIGREYYRRVRLVLNIELNALALYLVLDNLVKPSNHPS